MTAPKLVVLRSEKWDAIWVDYLRYFNFTRLAEEHGVSRQAIGRYAKLHGWERRRRIEGARRHLREHEEGLAFARSVMIEIARHMTALCRDSRATLAVLYREASEAHHGVWEVARHAALIARARADLRRAEAGEPDPWGCDLDDGFPPRDPRYERSTRWPEYEAMIHGYKGGRITDTVRAFKTGKPLRIVRPATA